MNSVGVSGTKGKADCWVEVDLAPEELTITVTSKVEKLYGKAIRRTVERTLEDLGVSRGTITVIDKSAHDFTIAARIESALLKAGAEIENIVTDRGKKKDTTLRRTRLYLPGNDPKLLFDGTIFDCDCVILDLEDSVSPDNKQDARILVRNALHTLNYSQEIMVRINPFPIGKEDLKEILKTNVDTILLPKVDTRKEIETVVQVIERYEAQYEKDNEVMIVPIIESARGVENAFEIASYKRVTALTFGAEDYLAGVGGQRNDSSLFYLRSRILNAAKACGIHALDTVFPDVNDEEGLEKETQMIKEMGYDGKGIIHPRQALVIHKVFTPSREEYNEAKKMVESFEKSEGVTRVDGRMVDLPVAKRAQKIIDLYEGR